MAADESNVCEEPIVESKVDSVNEKKAFTLEILQIIKESQQQHGLRHRDFQRYRSYCSRRLQRIRKSLKYVQKNRNKFSKKVLTDEVITELRFLYIPLVLAERAWSYAMQLKQESNTENRKRFHVITRLRKAVKHAEELEQLCQSDKCDARSKLESQAYCAWMKGTLYFELSQWHDCIEFFNSASTIYGKLGSAVTEDQKALYTQRVEEIAPSIRYCAYNIGDESAITDLLQMRGKSGGDVSSDIDTLLAQTREKQAVTLSEVTWRGRSVPVRSEHVRAFLITNKESEQELNAATDNDAKISIYENLLMECKDALQILRDEIRADPVSRNRSQATDEVSTVQYLHTYLSHIRLSKTVERNVLMAQELMLRLNAGEMEGKAEGYRKPKPQDLIRIYDIIIQSLSEIPQLPGLEEDGDLKQEIDAKMLKYKAYRGFYLAQTYSQAKKWKESAALFERAIAHAETSIREWNGVQNGPIEGEVAEINGLLQEINSLKYSAIASSILDTEEITQGAAKISINEGSKGPLIDRIGKYQTTPPSDKPELVTFPPEFNPVPCKPLFFDIALNSIEFPSLEEKLEPKKSAAAGGISGWMRGWWGGDKK